MDKTFFPFELSSLGWEWENWGYKPEKGESKLDGNMWKFREG